MFSAYQKKSKKSFVFIFLSILIVSLFSPFVIKNSSIQLQKTSAQTSVADDVEVKLSITMTRGAGGDANVAIKNTSKSKIANFSIVSFHVYSDPNDIRSTTAQGEISEDFYTFNPTLKPGESDTADIKDWFIPTYADGAKFYATIQYKYKDDTVSPAVSSTGYSNVIEITAGKFGDPTPGTITNQNYSAGFSSTNAGQVYDNGNINQQDRGDTGTPSCIFPNFKFEGCVANFFYYVFFKPASWIMAIGGYILDFGTYYTLQSKSYDTNFVKEGWKTVRDISNLVFIFVLLMQAGKMVMGKSMDKMLIVKVVGVGLAINFSLFFGKVIIDGGNILARTVYNGIVITQNGTKSEQARKPISEAILSKFNPQTILSFKNTAFKSDANYANVFTLVTLSLAIVCAICAYVFLVTGFAFIGRTVSLWLHLILAPIAMISIIWGKVPVPGVDKIGLKLDWDGWLNGLLKASFSVSAFLFFLVLIFKFISYSDFAQNYLEGSNFGVAETTLFTVIPFIFVVILLLAAKGIATSMGGKLASMAEDFGKKATGMALGVASMGTGLYLSRTVGAAGSALTNSNSLREAANKGGIKGWMAKRTIDVSNKARTGTFDFRNSGLNKKLNSATGLGARSSFATTGIELAGQAIGADMKTEGGVEAARKRQQDREDKKNKEYFQPTALGVAKMNKDAENWQEGLENHMREYLLANPNATDAQIKAEQDIYKAAHPKPESAEDFKKRQERTHAENIQNSKIDSLFRGKRDFADEKLKAKIAEDKKKREEDQIRAATAWENDWQEHLSAYLNANPDADDDQIKAEKVSFTATKGNKPITMEETRKKMAAKKENVLSTKQRVQEHRKRSKAQEDKAKIEAIMAGVPGGATRANIENTITQNKNEIVNLTSRINFIKNDIKPTENQVKTITNSILKNISEIKKQRAILADPLASATAKATAAARITTETAALSSSKAKRATERAKIIPKIQRKTQMEEDKKKRMEANKILENKDKYNNLIDQIEEADEKLKV